MISTQMQISSQSISQSDAETAAQLNAQLTVESISQRAQFALESAFQRAQFDAQFAHENLIFSKFSTMLTNSTVHAIEDSYSTSITITRFSRELTNLAKMYTDESKYSDQNDSLIYKLVIFHDICSRVDLSHAARIKAFSMMLKKSVLNYYYSNISIDDSLTFDEVIYRMRANFEDVEFRRSILQK